MNDKMKAVIAKMHKAQQQQVQEGLQVVKKFLDEQIKPRIEAQFATSENVVGTTLALSMSMVIWNLMVSLGSHMQEQGKLTLEPYDFITQIMNGLEMVFDANTQVPTPPNLPLMGDAVIMASVDDELTNLIEEASKLTPEERDQLLEPLNHLLQERNPTPTPVILVPIGPAIPTDPKTLN